MPLDEVVVVLDNARCHTNAEDVFDEEVFGDADVLKLGPYTPMLNHIANRFLARQRPAILRVPDGTRITEHRTKYLRLAADTCFVEIVTPELCNRVCERGLVVDDVSG
ncbi:Hypothetical protein PHPALM_8761 [Phytophthora palmivora]|uniref:Tc1-like transposase DDE domain-containing protein n=1 Tax=Phytophthora palmivora TaxID=4796 RepID=A0A2P4Y922_9STRA|nr:Hypothetical protein PHPALM_8761 [Phytophthora palmivora]